MVYSRKNRKSSRKDSRKNRKSSRKDSRKNRKSSRKMNMRRMNYFGGSNNSMELSLAQGRQYQELHQGQHGGSQMAVGAPVGYSGMLPDDLRASARVEPTFSSFQQIQGMSDMPQASTPTAQTGGRRRKASKKSRKSSKKSRKASKKSRKASKKSRKSSKKTHKGSRKMRGGMAEINSPTMLLTPAMAAKAGTADFSNPLLKY